MKDEFLGKKYIEIFINKLLKKNYSQKSIDSYLSDLFLLYEFLGKDLDLASEEDIRSYIHHISDEKDSSIKRKISCFKTFYKVLINDGGYDIDNPMKKIVSPKVGKSLPKFVYYNELLEIIDASDLGNNPIRDKLIIELLYATGMRVSELVNIKINDIDFSNNRIMVVGKGNKERTVYFGEYAGEMLEKYLKVYDVHDYLFLNAKGEKMSDRSVRYIIDTIMKRLSINTHVTPHVLRHTFATDMLNNGCDIRIVQELLGHSSLKTTEVYTHVTNDRLKEVYYNCFPRSDENE